MAYSTRQQQAVLQCLARRGRELISVNELAEELRAAGCPVGLATIYRQLERLEAAGHIHKVSTEEGAFYQYCDHEDGDRACFLLRCERCGRILHLDCSICGPCTSISNSSTTFSLIPARPCSRGCATCAPPQRKQEETHGKN
jgi:Fur family ferric uptake transcriptional regulator